MADGGAVAVRAPFPLEFDVTGAGSGWRVSLVGAGALDLLDVLTGGMGEHVAVLLLETVSFLDEDNRAWPPSRIAEERGVACAPHDLGGLSPADPVLCSEAMVLRRDDLARFLTGWSWYELVLVDAPAPPSPERLDEMALVVGAVGFDVPVLPDLAGSRLYYNAHDDCCTHLETTEPEVPGALVRRLFALFAERLLGRRAAAPDAEFARVLTSRSEHWSSGLVRMTPEEVTIELMATSRHREAGQSPPRVDLIAVCDTTKREWRLTGP